jgi:hypothetical protein
VAITKSLGIYSLRSRKFYCCLCGLKVEVESTIFEDTMVSLRSLRSSRFVCDAAAAVELEGYIVEDPTSTMKYVHSDVESVSPIKLESSMIARCRQDEDVKPSSQLSLL